MNESEQAQAIRDIDERHGWLVLTFENETQPGDGREAHEDRGKLLEIVDSQAQKIAELTDAIQRHVNAANFLQNEISEQAKEIERLKAGGLVKPGNSRMLIRNLRRNT